MLLKYFIIFLLMAIFLTASIHNANAQTIHDNLKNTFGNTTSKAEQTSNDTAKAIGQNLGKDYNTSAQTTNKTGEKLQQGLKNVTNQTKAGLAAPSHNLADIAGNGTKYTVDTLSNAMKGTGQFLNESSQSIGTMAGKGFEGTVKFLNKTGQDIGSQINNYTNQ